MFEHRSQHSIPDRHPCLAGHFPGNPVVPAVVLLECVSRALGDALGRPVRLTALPTVKFLKPLRPEQEFSIELQIDPGLSAARFHLTARGIELAQGRLEYAHDA